MLIEAPQIERLQEEATVDFKAQIARFGQDGTDIQNQYFVGERYSAEDFTNTMITHTVFERCEFVACDFSSTQFSHCVFRACDLSNSTFQRSDFNRCEFKESKAVGAKFYQSQWFHVRVINGLFRYANFGESSFQRTALDYTNLDQAFFNQCRFKEVGLTDCSLLQTSFFKTLLKGMDFSTSKLEGMVISEEATELKGAKVNAVQAVELSKLLGLIVK